MIGVYFKWYLKYKTLPWKTDTLIRWKRTGNSHRGERNCVHVVAARFYFAGVSCSISQYAYYGALSTIIQGSGKIRECFALLPWDYSAEMAPAAPHDCWKSMVRKLLAVCISVCRIRYVTWNYWKKLLRKIGGSSGQRIERLKNVLMESGKANTQRTANISTTE